MVVWLGLFLPCLALLGSCLSSHRHHHFLPSLLPSCLLAFLLLSSLLFFIYISLSPHPHLSSPPFSSPLRLLLFSSTPPSLHHLLSAPPIPNHLSSLLRLSFLILIGPYPPHTLCRWCLLPRNPRQPLLFCSIYTFNPTPYTSYIYKYPHIHIYKCTSRIPLLPFGPFHHPSDCLLRLPWTPLPPCWLLGF